MRDLQIAIIGAGIGGLALASLLHDDGHDVTIFERFERPAPIGSGLILQPLGLAVLESLQARSKVLELGAPIHRLLGYDIPSSTKILDVAYGPSPAPQGLAIHRASLFDVLWQGVQSRGLPIQAGTDITASELQGKKRVLFDSAANHFGPFDLVIDCSGAGSKLSPLKARPLEYGAIWGTVNWPINTALRPDRLEQRYWKALHMIGVLPVGRMPGDTTMKATLFWSLKRNDYDKWLNTPLGRWQAQAREFWPEMTPFAEQITSHDQMTMARYSHGHLTQLTQPALAIVGDAAHRASPQLGQGANMALLDAFALAKCLSALPLEMALKRYQRSRIAHIWLHQMFSASFTPLYQSDSNALPWLRNHILTPMTYLPGMPWFLRNIVTGTLLPPYWRLPESSSSGAART